jgi:protein SCO1/2
LFLTGDKAALHRTIVDGLKLAAVEKTPGDQENANDLFIHSTKLVLIDKEGRIRGYFDGETRESVKQATAAAKTLAYQ